MAIRYLVSDLDGTLLDGNSKLSNYTLGVLRRAQSAGIGVILASGRMSDSMLPFVRAIGTQFPFIACNGALTTDVQTGAVLRSDPLPAPLAREIARMLEAEDCYFHGYDAQGFYYAKPTEESAEYGSDTALAGRAVGRLSDYIARDTPKLLVIAEPEALYRQQRRLAERFGEELAITSSHPRLLEITISTATKGNALRALCERLSIDAREVVAFGDGCNDISLLEAAGRGVAVANAQPALKQVASDTCGSHLEDGVARYVAAHLLGEA